MNMYLFIALLALSCSKENSPTKVDDELPTNISANYAINNVQINQGENFISSSLNHTLPVGTTFSIKEIKNSEGKTSSAFSRDYQVGVWSQSVNKNTDKTEADLLKKYSTKSQKGITIDEKTGVITILGKALLETTPDKYQIALIAKTTSGNIELNNVLQLNITSPDYNKYVKGTFKIDNESTNRSLNIQTKKLDGNQAQEVINTIANYDPNKTYVRLKLQDARTLGINLSKNINYESNYSIASINPWSTAIDKGTEIILSSAIDRFPVLEQDSLIKGSITKSLNSENVDLNFSLSINIPSPGIYDVTGSFDNTAKTILWWPSGKEIYSPNDLKSNDFKNNNSQWSYHRMRWSDNFVVFWEKGFGLNPLTAANSINIDELLVKMEEAYKFYYDEMKFIKAGATKADKYRIQLYINEKSEWLATGAGYDSQVGAMWVNYSAANAYPTMAHEIAHTFQYLNHCDGNFAFTGNYNYIGQFWEQTAQYQATLLYPTSNTGYIPSFLENTHLNLMHEDNRYSNFYYLHYWHDKRGKEFVGKIWQEAKAGEDIIEAYKRLTSLSQTSFNDEIYDYAKKTLNWNFSSLSSYNTYINSTSSSYAFKTSVVLDNDNYYRIDPSKCVQAYGFNTLELNIPTSNKSITIDFEGLKNNSVYNTSYTNYSGWRWGIVAVKSDKSASYSTMQNTEKGTLTYTLPENTSKAYLIVTGAPTQHFHHIWDDNKTNDEQFPWKAKFTNTAPVASNIVK